MYKKFIDYVLSLRKISTQFKGTINNSAILMECTLLPKHFSFL